MQQPFYKRPLVWVLLLILVIILLVIILLNPLSSKDLFKNLSSRFSDKPKPGSCLILEEKYCKQAVVLKNPNVSNAQLVAYRVPKGTLLFAPIDGKYDSSSHFAYKDSTGKLQYYGGAIIADSKDYRAVNINAFYNFIYFNQETQFPLPQIKKGDTIGSISEKTVAVFGDYNLVFNITKQTIENGRVLNSDYFEKVKEILKIP